MFVRRMDNPLDYSLCDRVVSVYSAENLTRQVAQRAYYDCKALTSTASGHTNADTEFLLVIPGDFTIAPGDKVLPGIGPELTGPEDFMALTPDSHPNLGMVKNVCRKYWQGKVCHVEARG